MKPEMQQFVQQSLMISALVQLTLGAVCALRRRHRRLSRLYSYYSLGLFGTSVLPLLLQSQGSRLLAPLLTICLPLTATVFYHFVSVFVSESNRSRGLALGALYGAIALLGVCVLREILTGMLLWATVAVLTIPPSLLALESLLVQARSSYSRLEKRQLSFLFLSYSALLLGGLGEVVTARWLGGTLVGLWPLGLLGLALGTAVSILRHKFLDLPAQLGRGIGILVVAYLLWSAYNGVVGFIESQLGGFIEPRTVSIFQLAMATGVILLLFDPLKRIVVEQMDRVLQRESYNFQRDLTSLSSSLVSVLDLGELFEHVLRALRSSPRVEYAEILLERGGGEEFRTLAPTARGRGQHLDGQSALVQLLMEENRVLVLDEMERSVQLFYPSEHQKLVAAAARALRELGGEIVVPLWFQKKLKGVVVLRSAPETGPFTPREREILLSLAGQLAITVENARIYEQMRQHDRLVAVGEMATGLAHEVRNPLGAIKAAAQYLEPGMVESEDREFLGILIEEVDRLNNVVTRFLDYARPLQTRLGRYHLNEIVQKLVTLMAPEAASHKVEIDSELDPELPELVLDGEQIRQVLFNLILNAIEAMEEEGTVRVSTKLVSSEGEEQPACVLLQVRDTGRGIPEEELDRIFDPFYTTKGSGTGLGLAIAYRIVQAHGGTITVQSEVGRGTSFELRLPVVTDTEMSAAPAAAGAAAP